MQWTVRLEARTDQGEVEITELVTIGRPVVECSLAELGLALAEAKAVLAKLQGIMVQSQAAEYATCHRVCSHCRVPQPLKDRRTRRLQTLFGTVEVEALRFRVCDCCPTAAAVSSPVCALLTARGTPELERVQAELGVGILVGQQRRDDPARIGVRGEMQLAPAAPPLAAMLLDQPLAGATQLQPRAVHQQVHRLTARLWP